MALLFSLTASTIVFEVVLTRLFSTQFYYNFVYFTLSMAVLGIALGAAAAYRSAMPEPWSGRSGGRLTTWWRGVFVSPRQAAMAFAVSAPAGVVLLEFTPALASYPVIFVAVTLPFVFSGAAVSRIFAGRPAEGSSFYFVDLLGAALGAAVAPVAVGRAGLAGTSLLLGLGCAVVLVATGLVIPGRHGGTTRRLGRGGRSPTALILVVALLVVSVATGMGVPWLADRELHGVPRGDKLLGGYLRQADLQARILGGGWDEFSRTDLVATEEAERRYVFIDGGAVSSVYRWQGPEDEDRMRRDITFFPFELGTPGKVAVIGAGAGREVQISLVAGSPAVTAIELNRGSIELTRSLGEYTGRVYERPEVKVVFGDARGYLERSAERFDTIYLSLLMTDTAGRFGASLIESYALTVEAFRTYMERLAPGGRLVVQVHSGDELTKIVLTLVEVMRGKGKGVPDALARLIAVGPDPGQEHGTVHHPLVVFRPGEPYSESETALTMDRAAKARLKVFYAPYAAEGALRDLKSGQVTPARLERLSFASVAPAWDQRPFFYKSEKVVPGYLVAVLLASLVATLLVMSGSPRRADVRGSGVGGARATAGIAPRDISGPYFAGLGFGFMTVEMVLIQRMTAFLGHPVLAASIVLGALLAGAGIGSFAGGRFWELRRRVATGPVFCAVAALLVWPGFGLVRVLGAGWPAGGRLALASVFSAAVGLALGVPFPAGLSYFGTERPDNVPRFWAVNGAAAVLGSSASLILAMVGGFNVALAGGMGAYGLAAVAGALAVARRTSMTTISRRRQ